MKMDSAKMEGGGLFHLKKIGRLRVKVHSEFTENLCRDHEIIITF